MTHISVFKQIIEAEDHQEVDEGIADYIPAGKTLQKGLSTAANWYAARLGNETAKGNEDAKILTNHLKDKYKRYLAQSGLEMDETSARDFLISNIGFTVNNAKKVFQKAGISFPEIKDETEETNEAINEALDKTDINRLFMTAAQFAYANNLVPSQKQDQTDHKHHTSKLDSKSSVHHDTDIDRFIKQQRARDKKAKHEEPVSTQEPQTDSNFSISKFVQNLSKTRMTRSAFNETKNAVKESEKYDDVHSNNETLHALAKIGYAALKTLHSK
jgi:hypothetical protein